MSQTINRPSVIEVCGAVQDYAWGKPGLSSLVAQLAIANSPSFEIKDNHPYAELWMGTHPKAPLKQKVVSSTQPETVSFQPLPSIPSLPFLFKVLSVNKALSIQAHPNKALAKSLHASAPQHYPDANHKPEIAIALTPFKGLCGFRPLSEIAAFLQSVPELSCLVGETASQELQKNALSVSSSESGSDSEPRKSALALCFKNLMTAPKDKVAEQAAKLVGRLSQQSATDSNTTTNLTFSEAQKLVTHLYSDYPGDVGTFAVYFLNIVNLEPGQSMFLAANEPHAYLHGDCIECMANSDNVVRAGLTPKYMDVDTLCSMLTYVSKPGQEQLLAVQPDGSFPQQLSHYYPPVEEFAVTRIKLLQNETTQLAPTSSPGILLFIKGRGEVSWNNNNNNNDNNNKTKTISVSKGSTLYIDPLQTLTVSCYKDEEEGLEGYLAFCNRSNWQDL